MSLEKIKEEMLQSPEKIVQVLECFDFAHIELKPKEIRCARSEDGGRNISIRLQNNAWLYVSDFVKTTKLDIFAYIMAERQVEFKEVIGVVKSIFGEEIGSGYTKRKSFFRADAIREITQMSSPENHDAKTYDESYLTEYLPRVNLRFYTDHINYHTQHKFGLLYNVRTQRIGIPIRDFQGRLCGIKSRRNYETENPDDPKYIYELPCEKSLLLYGFGENYLSLSNSDTIYIGEAEKFVMQCDSYGYNNAVSIMGSTLSAKQACMLLSLKAKRYCFMFDNHLEISTILKNVECLQEYAHGQPLEIYVFDYRDCNLIGPKDSATDQGKEVWETILKNYVKPYTCLTETGDDFEI